MTSIKQQDTKRNYDSDRHAADSHAGRTHGSRTHGTSTGTSSAAASVNSANYAYNPSVSAMHNDPVYQGYHLTIPLNQNEPTGGPMPGGFTWTSAASGATASATVAGAGGTQATASATAVGLPGAQVTTSLTMAGTTNTQVSTSGTTSLFGTSSPSIDDINQGLLGDCYFDASVGSILNGPSGASKIENMITASSTPGVYDVHFFAKVSASSNVAVPVTIAVNASQLTDSQGMLIGNKPGASDASYPQILEKAYAIYSNLYPNNVYSPSAAAAAASSGSYNYGALDDHGTTGAGDTTIHGAMFALTGEATQNTQVSTGPSSAAVCASLLSLAPAQSVIANSHTADPSAGIAAPHVYTVEGYNASTGMVTLRDPHGVNSANQQDPDGHGQFQISLKTFQKYFAAITVGGSSTNTASN